MNWITLINGLPMESDDDLRQQIEPLLVDPTNIDRILPDIRKATLGGSPSNDLEKWSNLEPGVMTCISFQIAPTAIPDPGEIMALRQQPLDAAIATTAATGLLCDLSDHFLIDSETGFLLINGENPPTIEQAGEMFKRVMSINLAAQRLEEFGQWQTGALYVACETIFGEEFNVTQFMELSQKAYNTIITAVNTYKAFASRGRYNLSFTHHKEALFTRLDNDNEDRDLMHLGLKISEHFQLTCVQQRKLFRYARNFGLEDILQNIDFETNLLSLNNDQIDTIIAEHPNRILDADALVDRVTVREITQNFVFFHNNTWYRFRGAVTDLPAGSTNIICTDDLRQVQRNGERQAIPSWERPNTIEV